MSPLIIGIALALAALVFVVAPLVRRSSGGAAPVVPAKVESHQMDVLLRDSTSSATDDAVTALATERSSELEADAERLVRQARAIVVSCGSCGQRPESDAVFCSSCGKPLGVCAVCRHPVGFVGARFCEACGAALTA